MLHFVEWLKLTSGIFFGLKVILFWQRWLVFVFRALAIHQVKQKQKQKNVSDYWLGFEVHYIKKLFESTIIFLKIHKSCARGMKWKITVSLQITSTNWVILRYSANPVANSWVISLNFNWNYSLMIRFWRWKWIQINELKMDLNFMLLIMAQPICSAFNTVFNQWFCSLLFSLFTPFRDIVVSCKNQNYMSDDLFCMQSRCFVSSQKYFYWIFSMSVSTNKIQFACYVYIF